MPITDPEVRQEWLSLDCETQNSTRSGFSDTEVTDVAVNPCRRPPRQNVTTHTPEASRLKTSLKVRVRSSGGAVISGSLQTATWLGIGLLGEFDHSALAKRPNDVFHEWSGIPHRIIELANDAVEAEGLQLGDALADLLERADQPELKSCVRIHHLLLAKRGPGRGTGSADRLAEEVDRLRIAPRDDGFPALPGLIASFRRDDVSVGRDQDGPAPTIGLLANGLDASL